MYRGKKTLDSIMTRFIKKRSIILESIFLVICGCASQPVIDPIFNYKLEDPNSPHDLADLPCILQLPLTEEQKRDLPPTQWWNYDTEKWFEEGKKLIGKSIDEVINVFGGSYLICLEWGRDEPRMYYHFAGTHSWGIFGVVVLNRDLSVKYFDTDPSSR